jgi:hypothetical protein
MPHLMEIKKKLDVGEGIEHLQVGKYILEFLLRCNKLSGGHVIIIVDKSYVEMPWVNYYLSLCNIKPIQLIFGDLSRILDTDSFFLGISRMVKKVINCLIW